MSVQRLIEAAEGTRRPLERLGEGRIDPDRGAGGGYRKRFEQRVGPTEESYDIRLLYYLETLNRT